MIRTMHMPVIRLLPLALLAACSSGTEPAPEPVGPAARIVPASDTVRAVTVNAAVGDSLVVRVLDSRGNGVPGVAVAWRTGFDGGALAPQEALTDERGRARSAWRVGTRAGSYAVTASALTVDGPQSVRFRAVAAPGPAVGIQVSPAGAFMAPGESRQFTATRTDSYGNPILDRPVAWSSSSPGAARVDAQSGMVTAVAQGSADITAVSEGKSATVRVNVGGSPIGEDLFDANTLDRYTQYADVPASWSIAGGVLTVQGSGEQNHLVRNDAAFRDGWVEAEMDRADEGGLVLRFQDHRNLYLLAVRDDGSLLGYRNLEFFRRTNGSWQILTPTYGKDIHWPRGTVKRIRFEAVGGALRAYVDGVLVDEVRDTAIPGRGGVGMRYHDVPESPGADLSRYLSFRWNGT